MDKNYLKNDKWERTRRLGREKKGGGGGGEE